MNAALREPVRISRHSKIVAVLMSVEEYKRLRKAGANKHLEDRKAG